MKTQRIALALAAMLIGISSSVGGADAGNAAAREPTGVDPAGQRQEERANRNGPHPAVLSYERPVFPIRVPNPPVGLEHY